MMEILFKIIRKIRNWLFPPLRVNGLKSGSWAELIHWAKSKNVKIRLIRKYAPLHFPNPISFETVSHPCIDKFDSYLSAAVLLVRNRNFRFSNHHWLTDNCEVIYHVGIPLNNLPISHQELQRRNVFLNGTVAYLSNTATDHYGHWLNMIIPLLGMYQKELSLEKIDFFYIGEVEMKPFMVETFRLLNIPLEKVVNFPCRAKQMIVCVTEWKRQNVNKSYIDKDSFRFVRDLVWSKLNLKENCCYAARVYIARGNVTWRKVINEKEVFELLNRYDFEFRIMDNLSILEQAQIFYHAECIVAPHGSALTNLRFAQASLRVLEIFPYRYICPSSFALAAHAGCHYYYLKGKELNEYKVEPCYEDIEIDIQALENALKEIIGGETNLTLRPLGEVGTLEN
jgi:Glycosyltransferase 61